MKNNTIDTAADKRTKITVRFEKWKTIEERRMAVKVAKDIKQTD